MLRLRDRPADARYVVRASLLTAAWLAFLVVFLVNGVSDRTSAAFLAGLIVAWLWPRVWRWSDGERYERTQKAAPPRQPGG